MIMHDIKTLCQQAIGFSWTAMRTLNLEVHVHDHDAQCPCIVFKHSDHISGKPIRRHLMVFQNPRLPWFHPSGNDTPLSQLTKLCLNRPNFFFSMMTRSDHIIFTLKKGSLDKENINSFYDRSKNSLAPCLESKETVASVFAFSDFETSIVRPSIRPSVLSSVRS